LPPPPQPASNKAQPSADPVQTNFHLLSKRPKKTNRAMSANARKTQMAETCARKGCGFTICAVVVAVVATVTAKFIGVPATLICDGFVLHVECKGAPAQVKETRPTKPFEPLICKLYVAGCPALTVAEFVPPTAAKEKSVPVPVSATDCGLSNAVSAIAKIAVLAPVACGVKLTTSVHFVLAARLPFAGHVPVFSRAKSPALGPATVIELILRGATDGLLIVTGFVGLLVPVRVSPMSSVATDKLADGCGASIVTVVASLESTPSVTTNVKLSDVENPGGGV
jgi:hypothetical protein